MLSLGGHAQNTMLHHDGFANSLKILIACLKKEETILFITFSLVIICFFVALYLILNCPMAVDPAIFDFINIP